MGIVLISSTPSAKAWPSAMAEEDLRVYDVSFRKGHPIDAFLGIYKAAQALGSISHTNGTQGAT